MANFWATFGKMWATFYFVIWSHWLSLSLSSETLGNQFQADEVISLK